MNHGDFRLGIEFYTASGKWRCTDIGSRTILAIKLGLRAVITVDTETGTETSSMQDDESWLHGPPYAVEEVVFDEYSIEGCCLYPLDSDDNLELCA